MHAPAIYSAERRTREIYVRRSHVEDTGLKQRLLRRNRDLLIDEMRYAGLASAGNECLAQRIEHLGLRRAQGTQGHPLRACRARSKQELRATHRKGERTACRPP